MCILIDFKQIRKGDTMEIRAYNEVEVPTGKYEVNIEKMEIKETKNGDPMFSCWMRILAGEFENKLLFYNQVITKGFQIALVNKFLRSLETGIDVDSFVGYREYNNLIMDIHEAIDDAGLEYMIEYSKNFEISQCV